MGDRRRTRGAAAGRARRGSAAGDGCVRAGPGVRGASSSLRRRMVPQAAAAARCEEAATSRGQQGAGGSRLRRCVGSLGAPLAGQEHSDILHQERRRLPCVSLVFSAPSRPPRTPPPTTSWLASSPVSALSPATEKVMTDDSIPRSQVISLLFQFPPILCHVD